MLQSSICAAMFSNKMISFSHRSLTKLDREERNMLMISITLLLLFSTGYEANRDVKSINVYSTVLNKVMQNLHSSMRNVSSTNNAFLKVL